MERSLCVLAVVVSLSLAVAACDTGAPSGTARASGSAVLSNCTPQHAVTTVAKGTLSVAAYQDPPFAEVRGQRLGGAEGEIITRIALLECLAVKVVPGTQETMISAVTSGAADTTVGSWYRTTEREKAVRLSAPVLADRLTLVSTTGIATIGGLTGRRVGSVAGFPWNADLRKLLGADLRLYATTPAVYADLAAGRLGAVVDTDPSARSQLRRAPLPGATVLVPPADPAFAWAQQPAQTAFPVNKENPALVKAFDADLAALRETGELARIVESFGFQAAAAAPGAPNLR